MFRTRPTARRTVAIPAILGATLALATFTYPGGLACAYDDLHDLEQHRANMAKCEVESNRHDAMLVNLADRLALKDQIIGDLIRGRTTLACATRRFIEINSSNDVTRNLVESGIAGDSYEEKAARNVIDFAKAQFRDTPAPSNTPQRIEGEFRALFGKEISMR